MFNMKFVIKRFLLVAVCQLVFFSNQAISQVNDTNSDYHKGFDNFKTQINQQFDTFSQHNDSIFVQFLQKSWKEFEGKQNPIPTAPKPVNQPIYQKPDSKKIPNVNGQPPLKQDQQIPPDPEIPTPKEDALGYFPSGASFSFYGAKISLPLTNSRLPLLSSISRQGIIDYFAKAGRSSELNGIAMDLKEKSFEYKLNDWGLASLLLQAAKSYYSTVNEQVLFTWVGLLHSGYNVKVGYSSNRVYLLIPANVHLYTVSYTINNKAYYLLEPGSDPPKTDKLLIHEADYPGNKSDFSFLLSETPQFGFLEAPKTLQYDQPINLHLNKNLVDFYRIYPPCELKVYFNAPLSANAKSQLDAFFLPLLEKKNDSDRAAFLLDFVQRAINYQTDKDQFGHEKYLFADETIYYPAADCEDRAILLAKLIDRYTSLVAVGLRFPEHVSLAVSLPGSPQGKYVIFNNKRFYHCDPTYLGAGCGLLMPSLVNDVPEIINYLGL